MNKQSNFEEIIEKINHGIDKMTVIYSQIAVRLDLMDTRFDRLEKKLDDSIVETRVANTKMDARVTNLEVWRNSYQS